MENCFFEITLQRRGSKIWGGNIPAVPAKCFGIYKILNGRDAVLLPDDEKLREALPYHYRKAFDRVIHWWINKTHLTDVCRTDLKDYTGHSMGSIFATLRETPK